MTIADGLLLLADDAGVVTGLTVPEGQKKFTAKVSERPLRLLRADAPDRLATVDQAGEVAVFSFPQAQPVARFSIEKAAVNDLCLSADGGTAFLACDDNTVLARPLAGDRPPQKLTDSAEPPANSLPPPPMFGEAPRKGVLCLARSHNGDWLAGSFDYGALCLWDARTGRLLNRSPFERAETLSFSPDDRWLAIGGDRGRAGLLQLSPE